MDMDTAAMHTHMDTLAEVAAANGGRTVWLDMEGSDYTEPTIAEYERLKAAHRNVGICLQAYLKRTYTDIERLLPMEPRIRLVKGAYAEPKEIAYTKGRGVDQNYLALCVSMLASIKSGHTLFLGMGTHDVRLIRQVADHAQVDRAFEGCLRRRDALRHQGRPAAPAEEGRFSRARAHRVRRLLVSVVHAPAGRAAGERRFRGAPDAAVVSRFVT